MSNPLQDAVRTMAPQLGALFASAVEANRANVEARFASGSAAAVDHLSATIKAALPANGIVLKSFGAEADAAISKLAEQAITQAGGAAAAMVSLAELEIDILAKTLGA